MTNTRSAKNNLFTKSYKLIHDSPHCQLTSLQWLHQNSVTTYLCNLYCYNYTCMSLLCQYTDHHDDKQAQSYSLTVHIHQCLSHNVHLSNLHTRHMTHTMSQLQDRHDQNIQWQNERDVPISSVIQVDTLPVGDRKTSVSILHYTLFANCCNDSIFAVTTSFVSDLMTCWQLVCQQLEIASGFITLT